METVTHRRVSSVNPGEVKSLWVYSDTSDTLEYAGELQLEGDTLTIWFGEGASPAYYRGTFSNDGSVLAGACYYPEG
jgi:hypothetical protein